METLAYAKLNLSLDVAERRDDGFHNMVMVMQTVTLCDRISIELNGSGQISAATDLSYIPSDERNLAVKTARAYLEHTGRAGQGVSMSIKKSIPVGAGMAGGSADAAAVLRGLNGLFSDGMSIRELETLGAKIGSDVAFCVGGGTALAQGRGELLTPLQPLPDCRFVICKPDFSVSTPELFRKLDQQRVRSHPDTAGMLAAISAGDLPQICRRLYNVFEDVDDRRMRRICQIKNRLLDLGAMGTVMTGTGSAVFGVFDGEASARSAAAVMRGEQPFCRIARPSGRTTL